MRTKTSDSVFNKTVKSLSKNPGSLLDLDDVAKRAAPGAEPGSPAARAAASKLASRLVAAGALSRVRRGLWSASGSPADPDALYWKMLRKLAVSVAGRNWMVAGGKALELRLRDLSAPAEIRILTDGASGSFSVAPGFKARFVPLRRYGEGGKRALFSRLAPFSDALSADGVPLRAAGPELALLEYLSGAGRSRDGHLLSKALAKFAKTLRRDAFGALVSLRYVVAANRLKDAAKRLGHTQTYAMLLDVVKCEGKGCFVSR